MSVLNFYKRIQIEVDLLQLLLDLHKEFPEQDYLSIYEYISHGEYGIAIDAMLFDINELGASTAIKSRVESVMKMLT